MPSIKPFRLSVPFLFVTLIASLSLPLFGAYRIEVPVTTVVSIGINNYTGLRASPRGAAEDATAVYSSFSRLATGIFRKKTSKLLLDDQAKKATIREALEPPTELGVSHNLVLFFAGNCSSSIGGLLLSGYSENSPPDSIITPADVAGWVKEWETGNVLIILDTSDADWFAREVINHCGNGTREQRICILTCGASSIELANTPRGAFSYSLTRALDTSLADLDGDKIVNTLELSTFLQVDTYMSAASGGRLEPCFVAVGAPFYVTEAPQSSGPKTIEIRDKQTQATSRGERAYRLDELDIEIRKSLQEPGDFWALLIGVNKYDDADIRALEYSDDDVQKLKVALMDPGILNLSEDRIRVLTSDSKYSPTSLEVGKAFNWLSQNVNPNDTVLIYFAGHGYTDGKSTYLLTQDSDNEAFITTALDASIFNKLTNQLIAKNKLIVLDCCHSGGVSPMGRGGDLMSQGFFDQLAREASGEIRFFACQPNQVSYEHHEYQQGVFSYYLVKGLYFEADSTRDGVVTFEELEEYVKREVSGWARGQGWVQTPVTEKRQAAGHLILSRRPSLK